MVETQARFRAVPSLATLGGDRRAASDPLVLLMG